MNVRILSEEQVRALIELPELLDALARGFVRLSAGAVVAPGRNQLARPEAGFLLCMPGHAPDSDMAVKVVTVYEGNPDRGLPVHLATIGLYDPDTGACRAFMDGTYVTAIRTAAAASHAAGCRVCALLLHLVFHGQSFRTYFTAPGFDCSNLSSTG